MYFKSRNCICFCSLWQLIPLTDYPASENVAPDVLHISLPSHLKLRVRYAGMWNC